MKYKSVDQVKELLGMSKSADDKKFLIGVMFGECIYDI